VVAIDLLVMIALSEMIEETTDVVSIALPLDIAITDVVIHLQDTASLVRIVHPEEDKVLQMRKDHQRDPPTAAAMDGKLTGLDLLYF
jgi:hypothetical protein